MKYKIGRELVRLSYTLEHINNLEKYYTSINEDGNISNQNTDDEDYGMRYLLVQNLAYFDQLERSDLEDHYLGFGIMVIKKEKIISILKDKEVFTSEIKRIAKNAIMEHIKKSSDEFKGIAVHYFLASRNNAVFNIEIFVDTNKIIIYDAFLGYPPDKRNEYLPNNYAQMIGMEF